MCEANREHTLIKSNWTRLTSASSEQKINTEWLPQPLLADEGSSEQSVKVASKKLKGDGTDTSRNSFGIGCQHL